MMERHTSGDWFNVTANDREAWVRIHGDIGSLIGPKVDELFRCVGEVPAVTLLIDSLGGDSLVGLQCYGFFKARDTKVRVVGACCSSAAIIAMAGNDIVTSANARWMVHKANAFACGDADLLRFRADAIEEINIRFAEILTERTKQRRSVVDDWLRKDTYFSATDAVAWGLADRVSLVTLDPPIPDVEIWPTGKPDDRAQRLCLDMLKAIGPFSVPDKKAFYRELSMWFAVSVREAEAFGLALGSGVTPAPSANRGI